MTNLLCTVKALVDFDVVGVGGGGMWLKGGGGEKEVWFWKWAFTDLEQSSQEAVKNDRSIWTMCRCSCADSTASDFSSSERLAECCMAVLAF